MFFRHLLTHSVSPVSTAHVERPCVLTSVGQAHRANSHGQYVGSPVRSSRSQKAVLFHMILQRPFLEEIEGRSHLSDARISFGVLEEFVLFFFFFLKNM